MTTEIIDLHYKFLKKLKKNEEINTILEKENIAIVNNSNQNRKLAEQFYKTWYKHKKNPRIVLCGMNPGRTGAGKTGVPFMDFKSLSSLLPGIDNDDYEKGSQFMFSVIEEMGRENFFSNVYLTNISWFGFDKDGKNINYHTLPGNLEETFTKKFKKEIKKINPSIIIPLSVEVEKTLHRMVEEGTLKNVEIGERLMHPYYASFPNRAEAQRKNYIERIESYINC